MSAGPVKIRFRFRPWAETIKTKFPLQGEKKKSARRSVGGRIEKRSEGVQSKVSIRRRLNHILRRGKSGSSVAAEPSENVAEHDTDSGSEKEDVAGVSEEPARAEGDEEEADQADGGALSLSDLESDQLSPFVTRNAGSTPKVSLHFGTIVNLALDVMSIFATNYCIDFHLAITPANNMYNTKYQAPVGTC